MPGERHRDFLEAIIDRCRWSSDPRGELSRLAQLRQGFRRKDISRAVRESVRRLGLGA